MIFVIVLNHNEFRIIRQVLKQYKVIMKKIFVVALVSMGFLSCSNSAKNADKEIVEEVEVVDIHNAQNSLDYKGTYKGVLPCADCEGIETELKIDDEGYTRTTVYKGKDDKKFEEKGTYSWDANNKNIIILDGVKEAPNKYFVGENYLKQLDMDGNEITGDLADKYILKK